MISQQSGENPIMPAGTFYRTEQVAFQLNANHPLAQSMGYIQFEGDVDILL